MVHSEAYLSHIRFPGQASFGHSYVLEQIYFVLRSTDLHHFWFDYQGFKYYLLNPFISFSESFRHVSKK